jgi:hypothetical protein
MGYCRVIARSESDEAAAAADGGAAAAAAGRMRHPPVADCLVWNIFAQSRN